MKKTAITLSLIICCGYHLTLGQSTMPESYTCLSTQDKMTMDGKLDEPAWQQASWTNDFVDIEGDQKPKPHYRTRAKMLWDNEYFYVAAEIEEPHIWATYDQRDMIIFHENDFEVFIDPDGDTHQYYELEINALGTVWDLLLIKPYRDGGPPIDAWDIAGLKKGIQINGTLNDPLDIDKGWTVELAMPWNILNEAAKYGRKPEVGDTWRVNFSRVNWRTAVEGGKYAKEINPETGKSYPEYNWVWSPQGVIAMHQPETWGFVTFVNHAKQALGTKLQTEPQLLRQLYYAQKEYFKANGVYAMDIDGLGIPNLTESKIKIYTTPSLFEATYDDGEVVWHIDQFGRVWSSDKPNLQRN